MMSPAKHPLDIYRCTAFRTPRIRLRPARAEDQPLMFGWRSDVETSRFLSGAAPATIDEQRRWFARVCDDPSYSYHIVEDEGVPIGFTSMYNADPACAEAEWGLIIGTSRKAGDVRIVAPLCCSCAFGVGGLDALYVCVNEANVGAVRRVEQMGAVRFNEPSAYRKEGELLLRIQPDGFEERRRALIAGNPALADELAFEQYRVETGA